MTKNVQIECSLFSTKTTGRKPPFSVIIKTDRIRPIYEMGTKLLR
jgi:hypothetical protein